MFTSKFKKGDRVRFNLQAWREIGYKGSPRGRYHGAIGTVLDEDTIPEIRWDDEDIDMYICDEEALELLEETTLCGIAEEVSSVENTLSERGKRYGEFNTHARIAQCLKEEMRECDNWDDLSYDKQEALDMIQHKIARILNGDPEYKDNWHDIGGYAKLAEDNCNPDNN